MLHKNFDPNRGIMLMAPDTYEEAVMQAAIAYGGDFHNTGYMAGWGCDKLPALISDRQDLVQAGQAFAPVEQAAALRKLADEAPKSVKWRMRASLGDKVRWYELPEEVDH